MMPLRTLPSASLLRAPRLVAPTVASSSRVFSTTRTLPASHPAADASQSYIKGTVNEPTTYPPPDPTHGHQHWLMERSISVALLPLTAAALAKHGSSGALDIALGMTLVLHSHMGFDASLNDYLHDRKFPTIGPIARWALRGASAATVYGLYEMQTNDVGLSELVAKVWTA